MKEHFSELLEQLRRQLIGMGAEVESQIRVAVEALVEGDAGKARGVCERDPVVNDLEVRNEEAVISPSWSIHSGCATKAYSFIWGMAGENQTFDDMDGLGPNDLR